MFLHMSVILSKRGMHGWGSVCGLGRGPCMLGVERTWMAPAPPAVRGKLVLRILLEFCLVPYFSPVFSFNISVLVIILIKKYPYLLQSDCTSSTIEIHTNWRWKAVALVLHEFNCTSRLQLFSATTLVSFLNRNWDNFWWCFRSHKNCPPPPQLPNKILFFVKDIRGINNSLYDLNVISNESELTRSCL